MSSASLDNATHRRHLEQMNRQLGSASEPARLFFAPGRVNLFGAHLDHNGGPVMPTAIHRGTLIAARPRSDQRMRMASTLGGEVLDADLTDLPTVAGGSWFDYPLGVLIELLKGGSSTPQGLDLFFGGDLPIGAGLSSSASICVGTALALDECWGLEVGREGWVKAALQGERGFVGVQCGIMDPHAVGFAKPGHLLWLDCKDGSFTHLPLDPDAVSIVVMDTGVKRKLAAGAFNQRVQECRAAAKFLMPLSPGAECLRDVSEEVLAEHGVRMDPVLQRRARHVIGEVQRTFQARDFLIQGDLAGAGALMVESHESLRLDFEVSVPELDLLVDAIAKGGESFGGRLTGAGFGGCVVALVRRGQEEALRERAQGWFVERFGRDPGFAVFLGDEGPRELPLP